jgi:hypothetical protein
MSDKKDENTNRPIKTGTWPMIKAGVGDDGTPMESETASESTESSESSDEALSENKN